MRRFVRLLICLVLYTGAFEAQAQSSAIAEALPIDVQIDLLTKRLAILVEREDYAGIVALVPQFRLLDIDIPDTLYILEARALFHTDDPLAARDRLNAYLANTGRQGKYYEQATDLLLEVKESAEQKERQLRAEATQRRAELAQEASRATVLRIREAKRRLHQLGFWLELDSAELDRASREAIAIYQVRRDLAVNADVTDELLEKLYSEVPDSHECDVLVFKPDTPLDWERPIAKIFGDSAIPGCNEALRRYPDVVRFQIQYARALLSVGRNQDALLAVQQAADKGYPRALTLIGWMHEYGRLSDNGRPNYDQALLQYLAAAEKDYPEAQLKIGSLYSAGSGVTRSAAIALEWYRKAAEQGYAPAQVAMGLLLENGRGVKRNYAQALEWYRRGAESDYAQAQFLAGRIYERGRGVKRDKTIAMDWYTKAAGHGYADAIAKLSFLN